MQQTPIRTAFDMPVRAQDSINADSHTADSHAADARAAALPTSASSAMLGAAFALRVFLAFTFLYAGLYKLTDPGFFNPKAPSYIGNQLTLFAYASPLKSFLLTVAAPNAQLFGWTVLLGELAIGLGLLVGALFRVAAFFGAVLATLLWLSATWAVRPYFYGPDVFVLALALTLLLAGTGGVVALDPLVARALNRRAEGARRRGMGRALLAILGPAAPRSDLSQPTLRLFGRAVSRRGLAQASLWLAMVGGAIGAVLFLISVTPKPPGAP